MRVLGVIPARGGSRGIPRKALHPLAGRPLLAYTADAARGSRTLSRTIVSTDDEEMAAAARELGLDVPFLRPAELAGDDTPMLPVLQHALDVVSRGAVDAGGAPFDAVVLLQPTSPLRRAGHVDEAVELLERTGADSVVSVVEVPHQFSPVSVLVVDGDRARPYHDGPMPTRRQDKPRVFARNGPAVLAVRSSVLRGGSLYGHDSRVIVMSAAESVDIDGPDDLAYAEYLLGSQSSNPHS